MKARATVVLLAGSYLLSACSPHQSPRAASPQVIDPAGPGLSVVLSWTSPVDLDLYLTDPTGETAYFANRWTRSDSKLRADTNCAAVKQGDESHREIAGRDNPTPGRYRVGVDFSDRCGSRGDESVPFRVVVRVGDSIEELSGSVSFQKFSPSVLEFEVARDGSALKRVPPSGRPTTVLPPARRAGM